MSATSQTPDLFNDYDGFVEKFKPKKTTDDCYTPPNIYNIVRDYVADRYGISPDRMVRPFYPGGDYERFPYRPDSVVVDNPPFSIIARICRDLLAMHVHFFLFCPYLTAGGLVKTTKQRVALIVAPAVITYENGAEVNTCFVTDLEPGITLRTDPDLLDAIRAANDENRKAVTKQLPKFDYPDAIMTVQKAGWFCVHHTPYTLRTADCCCIGGLDHQRSAGKSIFGSGFLLTERAAAERAAAERAAAERAAAERAAATKWQLSDREKKMQQLLERRSNARRPHENE